MDEITKRIEAIERQQIYTSEKIDCIKIMMIDIKKFTAGASLIFAVFGAIVSFLLDQIVRH